MKAAEEAIKAVILINGGSAVAMVAFIGTLPGVPARAGHGKKGIPPIRAMR